MSESTLSHITSAELRVISPKQTVRQQLRDMWRYKELLGGLIRKELKVKYKDSVLGFVWSLLNPALYLAVYYFVFQGVLRVNIPRFAIFLLCGLLVWNFFSAALGAATSAVVTNASIVKKVAFPREILAMASVGASLVHFFLQAVILLGALAIFQHSPSLPFLALVPVALVALVLLATSLGILLSAINVKLRDTQHLLELLILVWFWATPIVYQFQLVSSRLHDKGWPEWLALANPITPIVLIFQRAFYNDGLTPPGSYLSGSDYVIPDQSWLWYAGQVSWVIALGIALFFFALWVFGRMQADFAEEL